jgi:hypothetical protein
LSEYLTKAFKECGEKTLTIADAGTLFTKWMELVAPGEKLAVMINAKELVAFAAETLKELEDRKKEVEETKARLKSRKRPVEGDK